MYRHIAEGWRKAWENRKILALRTIEWRKGKTMETLERPSRLDKARRLGYRAKQGFVVVRVKVSRGGMRKERPRAGRRPKHLGVTRIKAAISSSEVAEKRVAKKYPNLKVLGSYYLHSDGRNVWYEVTLVDEYHPAVKSDQHVRRLLGKLGR